ncbi:MAG TPA: hypothetical protein VGL19_09525, partial [Polyangiaceae bacterium]
MGTNLWVIAAGSVALLSGCSSGPTTGDSGDTKVVSTSAALAKPQTTAFSLVEFPGRGHGSRDAQRLATGQFVTPTALFGAVQQSLNPGLPAYPNFIAGEAVRSQLSPDGKILA